MQRLRETIRLFAGHLSERSGPSTSLALGEISARVNLQRLFNRNAKAGNTNIVFLFINSLYFRESAGAIRWIACKTFNVFSF